MDAKNNTFNEEEDRTEAIAVIAMDGRFPGADDLDTFWQNIKDSRESITHFSDQELTTIKGQLLNNPRYVKARGIIKDIELFDAKFFGFSPREAILLDPQRRLFLELCWNALEKAGYCTDKYTGQIGVFAGMAHSSYLLQYLLKQKDNSVSTEDYEFFINTSNAFLTTEISYKLNLNGPSLNINTACSTSLVATVTACKQLLNYECDMALAGGVSILLPQKAGYLYQEGGIPSPDGHCRAFDAKAAGTVPSAGAGVILLKRLEDAIVDNDNIEAVIIGSAINNDGSDKVGFTAPSVMGQAKCIAEAIADAEISRESISYIEAHGTGTQLGDPIEIAALTKIFNSQTKKKQYCAIGSVKTNIGHTDNAAGIAGLIKTVFALKDKVLPPSLHFENSNPNIDFASSPFYVNTELKPWKSKEPRRAGVSSFGIGGTNAHVILEEAPKRARSSKSRPVQMLMLSTKTDSALDKATNNLAEFLQKRADNKSFLANDFADMAFTLQVGRKDFAYRRAIVCQDSDEAVEILQNQETLKNCSYVNNPENKPKIVFMFPGQGEQYPNMGLSLYKNEVVFKRCVDECRKILLEYINFDICKILFPKPEEKKQVTELLGQTEYTQPALFVIEYALAKLFMSWGIKPQAVIGHSSGEYAAACIAGILSLQDALILITNRGKLTAQLEPGVMLAVSLVEDKILPLLSDDVFLSAVNSPTWCVVSGSNAAIKKFKEKLRATYPEQRVRTVKLQISHAFHSDMMEPMLQKFSTLFRNIDTNPPQIPFVSTATGKMVTESEIQNVDYWVNHIRNTVRFSAGIQALFSKQFNIFLELGPGSTLNALVKSHHFDGDIALIPSLCCAKNCVKKGSMAAKLTYQALAKLWLNGVEIDWQSYYKNEIRYRVPLPTYPFERQRYWLNDSLTHSLTHHISQDEPNNTLEEEDHSVIIRLKTIFKEILGTKEVGSNDSFFDLGGHSLLALQLIFKIEELFNINIPLSIIYQARTVTALAKVIIAPDIFRKPTSSLVSMQPKGAKTPLFLIHPIGGTVFCYIPLVKYLGKEHPVYAVQDPGINDRTLNFSDLETVANHYLREIKLIHPNGPYLLGGSSYGGTVAFEMANQLLKNGEEVNFVALLDSWASYTDIFTNKTFFVEIMQKQHELLQKQLSTKINIPKKPWINLQWKRMQLLLKYKPQKCDIKLHLFKARELLPQFNKMNDSKNYWQPYTGLPLNTFIVSGNHETILLEPNVQILAQKLQEYLDKID